MMAMAMAIAPMRERGDPGDPDLLVLGVAAPRTMFDQTSWATAPEAEITSPATTARIVANATPAMTPAKRSPPTVPSPPPSAWASSGAARLPPLPAASSPAGAEHGARAEARAPSCR